MKQDKGQQDEFGQIMGRDGFSPDLPAFIGGGSTRGLSWGLRLFTHMLSGVQVGSLDLSLPNGASRRRG